MAPILPNHCSRRCDAMRQSERKRDTRYSGIARIPGDFRNGRSNGAETSCPPPPLSLSFPLLSSPPLVASPPFSSVFSSAGTPDFHPESRESAERPAVFDTYVGNDRNFQPMKFERRGFAVRGWPGADRRQSLHYDSYSPTDPPPTQPPACYCSPIREYNYFESMK